jgi:hypothetical protein
MNGTITKWSMSSGLERLEVGSWKLEVEGWRAWKLSADEVSAERLSHHLSISAGEAHFPLDRH